MRTGKPAQRAAVAEDHDLPGVFRHLIPPPVDFTYEQVHPGEAHEVAGHGPDHPTLLDDIQGAKAKGGGQPTFVRLLRVFGLAPTMGCLLRVTFKQFGDDDERVVFITQIGQSSGFCGNCSRCPNDPSLFVAYFF